MIQAGKLAQYMKKTSPESAREAPVDAVESTVEHRLVINVIFWWEAIVPHRRKKVSPLGQARTIPRSLVVSIQYTFTVGSINPVDGPIVFYVVNLKIIRTPYENALMLALTVGGHVVKRILVDSGSYVDLMHFPAFLQVRFKMDVLISLGRVLTGFNGLETISLGEIVLPVIVGPVNMFFFVLCGRRPILIQCYTWTNMDP